MPNGDKVPDLGYWTARVIIFRDFLERQLPDADRRGLLHGVPLSTYDYKQWTKDDLRVLATSFNSQSEFGTLMLLKDVAANEPNEKLTAKDIEDAQRALDYLKPDACKDWVQFGKWINKVEQETVVERAAAEERQKRTLKTNGGSGALIDLHKNDNIAGDPMETLDQQKALQLLGQNDVKIDSDHSLKSPDPKAVALDAVKNLKGAVRTS